MNLINVYKEALQNIKLEDIELLCKHIIKLDNKVLLELSYEDLTRFSKTSSYRYKLRILSMVDKYCLLNQDITSEDFEELRDLINEKKSSLVLEFLNQKYTNFPQDPKELQNQLS
jgi:DNA helicase TIP49 (TBP-interacting protein)